MFTTVVRTGVPPGTVMLAWFGMIPDVGLDTTRATSTSSMVMPPSNGTAAVPTETVTVCPEVVVVMGTATPAWFFTVGAITWTNCKLGSRTSVTVPVTQAESLLEHWILSR